MLEIIGALGSACLAFCALPQAIQSYRTKTSEGVSGQFLMLWLVGEVATLAYVIGTAPHLKLLIANYIVNLACLVVILWYK
jgi:uncharacterized protein with PQ loop repeat